MAEGSRPSATRAGSSGEPFALYPMEAGRQRKANVLGLLVPPHTGTWRAGRPDDTRRGAPAPL